MDKIFTNMRTGGEIGENFPGEKFWLYGNEQTDNRKDILNSFDPLMHLAKACTLGRRGHIPYRTHPLQPAYVAVWSQ